MGDRIEVVRALLAAKADVSARNNDGITALMIASNKGQSEMVKLLKQAGAKE
jgi:ankyrin repeat protein